jgi:miniconductance mechanosensitive channel
VTEISDWLAAHALVKSAVIIGLTAFIALASLFIARHFVVRGLVFVVHRATAPLDGAFVEHRVLDKLAYVAPALIIYYSTYMFAHGAEPMILRLVYAYTVFVIGLTGSGALDATLDIYGKSRLARDVPIKGYIQIARLILILSCGVVIISVLLDRSPWFFLSGIGAATAVLLLIFRDTLLSFVASIQIASNDVIRVGDHIEMPRYNADGEVIDIALHTVKVQNNDLTITAIPTFKMIEESFKNWRGIQQAGARRIQRAVFVDEKSIAFLDAAAMDKLSRVQLLADYIKSKSADIESYNREQAIDGSSPVNGRRMTNIGTFRAYLEAYVRSLPVIRQDLPLVIRQLAPTANGVPLEIYAFVGETRWAVFERIQADIFDHVLACVPEFGLRVFQNPSG